MTCPGDGLPHQRGFRSLIMREYLPSRAHLAPCAECDLQVERWWRDFKQQPVIGETPAISSKASR